MAAVRAHWGLGSRLLSDIFLGGADAAEQERFARLQRESATAETAASSIGSTFAPTFHSSASRLRSYTVRGSAICGSRVPVNPVR